MDPVCLFMSIHLHLERQIIPQIKLPKGSHFKSKGGWSRYFAGCCRGEVSSRLSVKVSYGVLVAMLDRRGVAAGVVVGGSTRWWSLKGSGWVMGWFFGVMGFTHPPIRQRKKWYHVMLFGFYAVQCFCVRNLISKFLPVQAKFTYHLQDRSARF